MRDGACIKLTHFVLDKCLAPCHCSILSLCSFSQGEEAIVQRWLPHVPAHTGGLGLQFRSQRGVPGHEPPPQPLLHFFLTQHLSHGGSAQRAQQHGGLCQVNSGLWSPQFSPWTCNVLIKLLQSTDIYPTFVLWFLLYPNLMGGGWGLQDGSENRSVTVSCMECSVRTLPAYWVVIS